MERDFKDEIKEIKLYCKMASPATDELLRLILEIVFQLGAKQGLKESRN